ncbi:putative alpha-1,2-mannosidase [Kribbella orskensis]|uniref:Alpha-1,2-mannosidase n=2 Tax=Kribbellaceae TaxID=2726069 RepID=A0ABY2BQP1_9ACTN|nr:putative alpha-1,2-mannosidase [Kribbella sp. VKM Ac-2500]TCO27734.1 putative alpha-1,2-mannosidase [Kribbella orskensis]
MNFRRPLGLVTSLGLVVTMTAMTQPASAAVPAEAPTAQPVAAGSSSFFTSFEPGQPQPGYADEVETGPDGEPRAGGVEGPTPTGIGGSEMDKVTKVTANDENTGGGEIATNVADGDKFTKWLVFEPTGWLVYETSAPVTIKKYALTSANDADGRDPKNWTVSGSNDGTTWTTLDTRTGEDFENRFQTKEYTFGNDTAYKFFKLDITLNHGEDIVQLADWYLSNGAPLPPPGETAESRLDSGPTSAYNARARTGFTGVKSFRYAGHQTAEGRGFTWNRIADVDLEVGKDTRLAYKIFPEHVEGDLSYPSTSAAVDLAFSDGTYLSDLKAKDHHGFPLSPRGQGDAKGLSTNQWNNIEADLGKVAAGKTVKRILVGYDKPSGPADFRGWIDDVRISKATNPDEAARKTAAKHPSDLAITTRGTNSTGGFSRGNNFPATAVPHGFNFWTPVTNAGSTSWLYDFAKGNNDQNKPQLEAFSISHEPSPWMGDRQTFQVMPSTAATPTADRDARAWAFSHDNEVARPYYYGVTFDNGNAVELTPTDHAAMLRFSFPAGEASLIFDNTSNLGGLTLDAETGVVTGYSDVKSGLSTGAGRLFVYGVVDQEVTASGKLADGGGANVGGYFSFDPKVKQVQLRVATSLIGTAQAKKNLELELAEGSKFDKVKAAAQQAWDAKLRTIEVEGATADQLTTLYSNLYRLFLYPNNGSENTGTAKKPVITYASPTSPKVAADTPSTTGSKIVAGQTYVNNGFWDTYRTVWPAYSLLAQGEAADLVNGFVQQYKDGGWISRWSSPGYANLMVGTSSDVAFADAYLKGIKGIDVQAAYDAALKNAAARPPTENVGRKGLDRGVFNGYTANTTGEGFSWSMDGYINDLGIANMSKALYGAAKKNDPRKQEYLDNYDYYLNRARNYVTLFDPALNFFQGKGPDGVWGNSPSTFDPRDWGHDYTETNAWNMAFSTPQDGAGLAALYGGRDGLAKKLDEFFSTPEDALHTGGYGGTIHEMLEARDVRMGQYGHSNQPSHHIAYMYNFTGQPAKTQEKVREVLDRLYLGSEIGQGYPGDEDNGEMSAWYLFSMLGFYPLQVGSPTYAIGAPLFTKATVRLADGNKLVISAPKNSAKNLYVKGVRVNGKKWSSTALPHSLIADGGKIEFDMTDKPSSWGTGRNDAPPSLTKPGEDPKTWRDSTEDEGAVTAAGGVDVSALTDNDSKQQVTLTGATPTVTVQLQQGRPVAMYSLTSGNTGTAPSAWVLEGSNDGTTWATVDRRTGQTWAFPAYTRSFSVVAPKPYTQYRLVMTPAAGTNGVTLSELELLGTLKGVEAGTHPSDQRVAQTKPSPTPSQSLDRNYG